MKLALLLPLLAFASAPDDDPVARYESRVKPLLAERCFACHGALKQEGGLRVDTAASMLEGGVIDPGDPSESTLIARIADPDPHSRMPPEGEGNALSAEQQQIIAEWIAAGAPAPTDERPETDPDKHWAFLPPVAAPLPAVADPAWQSHPIDAFVEQQRELRGLPHASQADPALLLRRLHLDLVGMPPTVDEIEAFVADPSDAHYESIVDRLLDDPRHAQRWARHWMDIWRYSDWWGLGAEVRNSQKHIRHWRDWIVDSLKQDLGYDRMILLMLAGDEIAPTDPDSLRAGGFLARQYFKFNRDTWLDETVEHTGKAFLGLTFNCSRCHDHKYDPFTSREYASLRAFFEPYQVRTDIVPGTLDVEADGIPRPFDCHLDAPTYRYLRGDAKQPIVDDPIAPDFPAILRFVEPRIEPVSLPVEAYRPGVRPWVVDLHLARARQRIEQAERKLAEAEQAVEAAREREAAAPPAEATTDVTAIESPALMVDDFDRLDETAWRVVSGEWTAGDGQIEQTGPPLARSELELLREIPNDFEATLRFTIRGGSMWRSVGLAFDLAGDDEQLVYVSAYEGGPKVQIAPKRGGNSEYPADGMKPIGLTIGQTVELRVRVRGTLFNVDIDGQPMLAWNSTLPRTAGPLRLIAFDAQAGFDRFDIRPLDPGAPLRPATGDPQRQPTLLEAGAAMFIAIAELDAERAAIESIEARAAADRIRDDHSIPIEERSAAIARAARRARIDELLATVIAASRLDLERATLAATAANPDDPATFAEIDEKIATAVRTYEQANRASEAPGTEYPSLQGAVKSIESPTETPESLAAPFPSTSTGRRTALAEWIVDRRHPLTARVAVNHLWTRHFGAPLVPTLFEFGRKGAPPSHPELLDYLAVDLMEHGWSLKRLHRLMVTSRTYRMSSSNAGLDHGASLDPENRMLWRMNPIRLEAQAVRDSILFLAGELDLTEGGPPIPLAEADSSKRRSLYFVHSHNEHHRLLSVFDDAGVQECYRREQSIVPQQALALSNSRLAIESSRAIAARIVAEAGSEPIDDDRFVRAAFRWVLAFEPNDNELAACREALDEWRALETDSTEPDEPRQGSAEAYAAIVLALLNHNDFLTVR
ncbi:MAG TPA: PSD1 and planctomycete cytochrome C domain-containing protein [Pirellulaceae bacterium]|nr:PSD1 and planctomycete cytochrome C domain-containing protein [Pirellulaceae bacterium]